MSFWNFVKNAATETEPESVELQIRGDIIDDEDAWLYEWFGIKAASPNAFRQELAQYAGKDIVVWIDSYGGSVFAAAGIYNALMEHKQKGPRITTKGDGKVMSAATSIFAAGDERLMSPMTLYMMHNPITGAYGYASDLRKTADVLDEVKETIVNAYQLSSGRSRAKIAALMDDETFMSAKTAIKEGFATGMLYTDGKAEPIDNAMMYSRMSIQNSVSESLKRFIEAHKNELATKTPPPKIEEERQAPLDLYSQIVINHERRLKNGL